MLAIAIAVLLASLLGSLHCVGMCGPLALWATGGGTRRGPVVAYHLGRLTTYLSAGLVAGVVGTAVTLSGELAGWQSLAAKLAGGVLIFVGLLHLFRLVPFFQRPVEGPGSPSRVAGWLQAAKPCLASFTPSGRAYFGGLLTTWLPCGWLYLFILMAAGTGSTVTALVVMTAFWVGTLPALSAVLIGVGRLVPRFRRLVPLTAGMVLIMAGLYTATGRASADLSTMLPPPDVASAIDGNWQRELIDRPLPCCEPVDEISR